MGYGDGLPPECYGNLIARTDFSKYFDFDEQGYRCTLCGQMFDDDDELRYHESVYHTADSDPKGEWDHGQLDLQNGISMMWGEFMAEHDLPRVVSLFGDGFTETKNGITSSVPFFYEDNVTDGFTKEKVSSIVFHGKWLHLDAESKAATLAHLAVHVENYRHGMYDITWSADNRHNKYFKRVAATYDLFVENAEKGGFCVVKLTNAFREKHRRSMMLMRRYRPLTLGPGSRAFYCYV